MVLLFSRDGLIWGYSVSGTLEGVHTFGRPRWEAWDCGIFVLVLLEDTSVANIVAHNL